jgi:pSer/pThr/pTyr-binding forkhead associated (FHA) protein
MTGAVLLVLRVLMAGALYAFLGWALYILWRDLKAQTKNQASDQIPEIHLATLVDAEPLQFNYQQAEVIIGRELVCDCRLADPTVSNRHARLSYHHSQWWAEDLQSRNGTFLNGEAVEQPIVIVGGDSLRCGQVTLEITLGKHAALDDGANLE